ncbi:hypothetical protein SDC9_95181 [bioreactor metagenome]|uniref:Uncharacterized protein n=1 Tax=bioreactor metagenome TaxID=1076179 RepID=A0A645A673_9ZZZZ
MVGNGLQRGGQLLHRAGLLGGALGQGQAGIGHLHRAGGYLVGRGNDGAHQSAQIVHQGRQLLAHIIVV